MLPLAGYADKLSVRPGETIRFKVSNATGAEVDARLVRVISADPNPDGPGIRLEPLAAVPRLVARPAPQAVPRGSYALAETGGRLGALASFAVFATVRHELAGRTGTVLSMGAPDDPRLSVTLSTVVQSGGLSVTASLGQGAEHPPLSLTCQGGTAETWHHIAVSFDMVKKRVELSVVPIASGEPARHADAQAFHAVVLAANGDIRIGGGHAAGSFNGRIERPMIFRSALKSSDLDTLSNDDLRGQLLAAWDFSKDISTDRIVDIGPHGLHGRLVNSPTRAMTGSNWTGREMSWRHAPEQYGAIHFHEDDIEDCGWPTTHEWQVPAGTRSGTYALMLKAGAAEDNIPFFVCPPKGKPAAKVCVLVSTFTYTVYANFARPEWISDPAWRKTWIDQAAAWGAYPHNPGAHPEYGFSTYNHHPDGSGISLSSWHRPILNLRIGYFNYPEPAIRASGLRHFAADTHLSAWLEAKGIAFDTITDWELHQEGHELLKDYPVVLTGSHPEYHTREMLDALTRYRDTGGRFAYLGGNGFYWKIALSPTRDGVIEIRRGEGGIRAWAAEPGEYYNQFDGEYGGLWRRNGRPPQMLCGVGFTAQGNFVGSYYRKTRDAQDPRVAWMFNGIKDEIIGDFGLSGHGAAGFELDRTDKRLGTPAHAVVVAMSEKHPPDAPWVLVPEEHLTHMVTLAGPPAKQLIRADMTFFETAGGQGAVFSTGSITFCGSLPVNGFDNNVSRLLENVVRRFLDPRPFPMPAG